MMGHRIKVINDPTLNTYRMSVSVTTPNVLWIMSGIKDTLKMGESSKIQKKRWILRHYQIAGKFFRS
jgi:hypothetical protein